MADGELIDVSGFYQGTFEIAVKHSDGSIIRYTELWPDQSVVTGPVSANPIKNKSGKIIGYNYKSPFKLGQTIEKVQAIGTIKHTNGNLNMLHLEAYKGDYNSKKGLSTTPNLAAEDMKYVNDANYNRRDDLIDPTWSKYLK